jgi:hypothetical protein
MQYPRKETAMPVKKLTPTLFMEKIEPVLPFWTQCGTAASWHSLFSSREGWS